MKYTIAILLLSLTFSFSENNITKKIDSNSTKKSVQKENNSTIKSKRVEEQIKAQMEKEKKYAKEMIFYQGDEYDLKAHEVDPNALPDVPLIEPDYDFEIDDVYRDDL